MLDAPAVGWVLSVLILLLGAIFFVIPCWVRLWQWRSEHHIITKACLLLLIPDLVMIVDFVPIHIRDLVTGTLVDDRYCKASSYLICACILASNVGNITVAYVTRRMLDPKDQKVTTRTLYVSAAIGWLLGLALASYFLGQDYLGSHRGVYCCTTQVRRGDIAGPVFFVYGACIAAMVYLYRTAYMQVAAVVMPSTGHRTTDRESSGSSDKGAAGSSVAANGKKAVPVARKPTPAITSVISGQKSSESMEAEETIAKIAAAQQPHSPDNAAPPAADGQAANSSADEQIVGVVSGSPAGTRSPLRSPHSSSRASAPAQQSASASIARRAILMVLAYYACWSLISLNAVFELAGWDDRSLWWDVVAAWASKLQPSIDAFILLASMTKVHDKRQAMKQRNAESSNTAPQRLHVKVDGSQPIKAGAMSPRAASTMFTPSSRNGKGHGRLVSNGAVSPPRGTTAFVLSTQPASPDLSPPPVESPPPPSPSPPEDPPGAATSTITHRRTVSSEIVQYQ